MNAVAQRTALVTGANRGIGRAIARSLVARGVRVYAAARTSEAARDTASALGEGALPLALDLAQGDGIAPRITEFEEAHGGVDILVNNAGVLLGARGLEVGVDELRQSLAVNTLAPYALIHAVAPGMTARGWGRIVNVSSGWGSFDEGLGGPTAYSVSKAALNALTVSLAAALGPEVKINAACPGWVRTRMGGRFASSSAEEGADTPVWLATLPDDGPTGGFYRSRRLIEW